MNITRKHHFLWAALAGWLLAACGTPPAAEDKAAQARQEILQAEKDFAAMAKRDGLAAAFLAFAADSAVLNRNNRILSGKEAMKAYFDNSSLREVKLQWEPDFVDASRCGDMGYTYGPYRFSAVDTSGQTITAEGLFHTVWKRQADGSWKFVYD